MPFDGEDADIALAAVLSAIGCAAPQERKRAEAEAAQALTTLLKRFDGGATP